MQTRDTTFSRVTVNNQGRVVTPAALRRAVGIKPGDEIVAHVEDGHIVLETPAAILARIRARSATIPPDVDLVEELLADRREAGRRENEELGLE